MSKNTENNFIPNVSIEVPQIMSPLILGYSIIERFNLLTNLQQETNMIPAVVTLGLTVIALAGLYRAVKNYTKEMPSDNPKGNLGTRQVLDQTNTFIRGVKAIERSVGRDECIDISRDKYNELYELLNRPGNSQYQNDAILNQLEEMSKVGPKLIIKKHNNQKLN